jgi:predicted  nucleic acid-binding Zn-ribbon protein
LLVSTGTDVLKEYKEILSNTTSDLEDHLQEIERKLKYLPLRDTILNEEVVERDQIRVERESTMQCLIICAQVSKQVNQLRPNVFEDLTVAKGSHQADVARLGGLISAKRATASTLQELQEKLTNTTSNLEQHLQDIDNRLRSLSSPGSRIFGGDERDQVQTEKESIK